MRWLPKLVPSNLARAEIIPVALDFGPVTVKVSRALSPTAARRKGGVPGAPPPPSGWAPPGFTSPPPQPGPAKRRHLPMVAVASIAAVAILLGAGFGHLVWSAQSGTNAIASPNSGLPSGSGSSGSGSSPFGSGSSGSGCSPFGAGSSGNSSTGAGAPSDISAIASKVDPGLVD